MSSNPTIEQMNEAIALFMELPSRNEEWRQPYPTLTFLFGDIVYPVSKLKYHSSFDWLMPVVEKISKIKLLNHDDTECTDPRDVCHPITFGMPTEDGLGVLFRFKGFGVHEAETLIEAAHAACYEVAEFENNKLKDNGCE